MRLTAPIENVAQILRKIALKQERERYPYHGWNAGSVNKQETIRPVPILTADNRDMAAVDIT